MNHPNEALVQTVLKECDEYLASNKLNQIGSGSILHRRIREALAQQSPVVKESLMAAQRQESAVFPKVFGVGRDAENGKALIVGFASQPTDDDLRSFHDFISHRAAPPAAAEVVPADSVAIAACRAVVEWCDKNPPTGDALWCVNLCRFAIAKAPAFSPVAEYENALRCWQAEYEEIESGNRTLKGRIHDLEAEIAKLRAQSEAARVPVMGEAVAHGLLNSAITGQSHALMQVEIDVPSNDQYGGMLWQPLYLAPTASITQEELDGLRKDAGRYQWLRGNYYGANFDFDDEGTCVLAFEISDTVSVSADCDDTIDRAMQEGK